MAFVKRNWLARIGIGLNKFLIGDKDADGKQTLTNSPDSVTQQGDVISADNLNDLEDRIGNAFTEMKLTKIWENPNPNSSYSGGSPIDLGGVYQDIVIEFNPSLSALGQRGLFKHIKVPQGDTRLRCGDIGFFYHVWNGSTDDVVHYFRHVLACVNTTTEILFNNCLCVTDTFTNGTGVFQSSKLTNDPAFFVPIAIYVVGDIYNN